MDVRHEPYQQEILNQLILIINQYIINNTDELLLNNNLQEQVKEICKNIYRYTKQDVDVKGILSKHNLLSIDVVLFPSVDVENQMASDKGFDKLMTTIKSIMQPCSRSHLFAQMNQSIEQSLHSRPSFRM